MVQICHLCKKGEIVHEKRMSGLICTGCGECFELGAFTDEVQYREDERGRYMAVGNTYNVEKGFVNSKFSNHAQFMTSVENARSILKRYCDKLYISESFSQISSGFYQQLLMKKFMNGRRLNVVLAACLYISVRSEGANVILLDISDVSEANVYDIGRYYFQIIRILHFNIQTVDPCEYTIRFVDMLNLGDRSLPQVKRTSINIRDTANRLVQRMKRDWIHFGRRPSGVCASAVLVACRINNVRCTIKDIISIAKVCESTIRKRINEFIQTPASKLTYKEFMSQDLDQEEDPPSYKMATLIKEAVDENLEKVEKYQEIIEEHLNDSRQKLRGVYAKYLKEILITQSETEGDNKKIEITDDDNNIIQEAILDQNILAVNQKIVSKLNNEAKIGVDKNGNPSAEEIEYWAQFRPSAKSLGLLKREESNEIDCKAPYEDLLNEDLNDMDDDELNAYIISDESEVNQRHLEWSDLNKDYIKLMDEKETSKREQNDDDSKSNTSKSHRKKRRKVDDQVEASTTSEAVEAVLKAKNISLNGINLKELFNEESNTSANVEKPKSVPSEVNLIISNNETILSNENTSSSSDNPKDAQFVSIYHSYASKSTPADAEENSTQNATIESPANEAQAEKIATEVETEPIPIADPIADLTPPSSSNDEHVFSVPSTSKHKLDNEPEEDLADEEDEDDYYEDDDDELSRIKQKYSMMGQNGNDEVYDDEYEDCGF